MEEQAEKRRITLYLTSELWDRVKKQSIDEHRSASKIIEQLAKKYLEEVQKQKDIVK
ncbi:ribbon-helix-helix protein, CopG family [Ligilactobacillus equi]|uniref:Ribbon-helix-helix protein CopG domain-containing protein n=1 Tax=Ligilactobacillus equi DSM 15833 = JCM 10991 TaxID=1423740 RepID=A0A0R1TSZ5_9LACO|nr:ribbon-helix-helix protein, CopG family [Ligilactobacillus equi]KRL84438.1 hypothetical protein FC36_GL000196 [Ligilactobacillus equi DSM 15833 = JCM 10991]